MSMDRSAMEQLIGDGQALVTRAKRKPFTLTHSDYGLEFELSSGNRRRTPWHGPKGRQYGVVELYVDWVQAKPPQSIGWINRQMTATGVGTRNGSYILAALEFFAESSRD